MSEVLVALAVVGVVSLLFMLVGLLHGRRFSRTVEDFISARGSAGLPLASASMVATALGVWILFSPGETGTFGGVVALVGYSLGSAAPLLVFIPLGRRMRQLMPEGHSLTEYVWYRFGRGMYAFSLGVPGRGLLHVHLPDGGAHGHRVGGAIHRQPSPAGDSRARRRGHPRLHRLRGPALRPLH